jgi:hypothetical protein
MSYLAELHAERKQRLEERKQRLARLGAIPDKGLLQCPPRTSPRPPAPTLPVWTKAPGRWPKLRRPLAEPEAVPLSIEQRRAALAAADAEPSYVWARRLDQVAKCLGIDEKHLTIVLLIGSIAERVIFLANSRGQLS